MPPRKRNRRPRPTTLVTPDTDGLWHITTPTAVPRLVDEIFDDARYRPLLIVSQANDTKATRINLDDLRETIGEDAYIAVVSAGETTWALSHALPERFRAYGGGIRLVWPYASRDDDQDRHPLFITMTAEESDKTIINIARCLRSKGYLTEHPAAIPDAPWHAAPADDDKVTRLLADLASANDRITALTQENADLRKTIHSLTDRTEDLQQRLHATNLYTDPADQLRHEIEHAWLLTYTEPEREQHPLATYTFGSDFVDSVNNLEGVDRSKIIATCVDVLTRRAWEVNGRQARQLRSTPAPNSAYVTRSSDGAAAWRCNIQTATASARRLMWWEIPDGSIELAVAALHDDYTIH